MKIFFVVCLVRPLILLFDNDIKMAKKALITGASGLLGRQVLTAFREAGWDVVGTGLSRTEPPTILRLDLANVDAVLELLDSEKYGKQII